MGTSASYEVRPQELAEFRKLKVTGTIEEYDIPQRPENRVATNRKYLVLYIGLIIFLIPCLVYCLLHADLRRLTFHYDACGNLCGYNNSYVEPYRCTGKNMVNRTYLKYAHDNDFNDIHRECVAGCDKSTHIVVYHKCFPKQTGPHGEEQDIENFNFWKTIHEIINSLSKSWWRIVVSIFIAFGVSLVFLVLYRFAVAMIVWTILIGSIMFFMALFGVCVYYSFEKHVTFAENSVELRNTVQMFRVFAAITGIIGLILLLLVICMRKRIGLVIQIMKEAVKAIFASPGIIAVPFVVSILQNLVLKGLLVATIALTTSGKLTAITDDWLVYKMTTFSKFTLGFNVVMAFLTLHVFYGIEYMIIAGTVATWYFTKNKNTLSSPVWKSIYITLRFHLGTVVVGSMIITLVAIVRALLRGLTNSKIAKALVDCCMKNLEEFLRYLSKNAYVMTAIHGQSFYRSGKRAVKLLIANAIDVVALNSVGDFVLGVTGMLVVILSTAISSLLFMNLPIIERIAPMFIIFLLTTFVVACFFTLFETAIDTIFLCFCEDCNINDGMARPYYMSRAMFEFMNDSKTIMGEKKK